MKAHPRSHNCGLGMCSLYTWFLHQVEENFSNRRKVCPPDCRDCPPLNDDKNCHRQSNCRYGCQHLIVREQRDSCRIRNDACNQDDGSDSASLVHEHQRHATEHHNRKDCTDRTCVHCKSNEQWQSQEGPTCIERKDSDKHLVPPLTPLQGSTHVCKTVILIF